MNDYLRNTAAALLCAVVLVGAAPGCGEPGRVTILFTGDEQGRLVPAG